MSINGENKFLRITVGNLISIVTTVALFLGFYYRLDARVMLLENNQHSMSPEDRSELSSVEHKIDDLTFKIAHIERDVAWLVAREPNSPK